MPILFESLTTFDEIEKYRNSISTADKENASFEAKALNGDSLTKEVKKKLAKEISAFANTYGGLIWLHGLEKSQKQKAKKISKETIQQIETPLENWLRDSLEPRLNGMEIKEVEQTFLIKIPESSTKPHRSQPDGLYYYRHSSQSEQMPEIMVSSMYKAGGHLSFQVHTYMHSISNNQIRFMFDVENSSRVAGTMPKAHLQIYGEKNERCLFAIDSKNSNRIGSWTEQNLGSSNFHCLCSFVSQNQFSDEILYPSDKLTGSFIFTPKKDAKISPIEMFKENKFILVHTTVNFLEAPRYNIYEIWIMSQNKMELAYKTESRDDALQMYLEKFKTYSTE